MVVGCWFGWQVGCWFEWLIDWLVEANFECLVSMVVQAQFSFSEHFVLSDDLIYNQYYRENIPCLKNVQNLIDQHRFYAILSATNSNLNYLRAGDILIFDNAAIHRGIFELLNININGIFSIKIL